MTIDQYCFFKNVICWTDNIEIISEKKVNDNIDLIIKVTLDEHKQLTFNYTMHPYNRDIPYRNDIIGLAYIIKGFRPKTYSLKNMNHNKILEKIYNSLIESTNIIENYNI